ncbi:MAG TPA: FAD-binding oxidoreductase [Actinomycetota bacterium]|nr:FAD-binding oxidoreductase [Actinomycetota bacterium]
MSDHLDLSGLRSSISGEVLGPDDAGYDDVRRIHNGLIDRRPAVIARCRSSSDIAAAIGFARANDLDISVRGGGHNVAGLAVIDDALMVDLSLMKSVEVDPDARTVRAEGGVIWAEFNDATHAHGLATTGGIISTTGIAGLTLGGGLGWLMPTFGLAADNLIGVELVTADGEILQVDAESHPDLFWALKGGGGNFGAVASFTYGLHPLSEVTGGLVAHPFDAARDVLAFYRDFTASISDNLMVVSGLVHAPDGSGVPLSVFGVCHVGPPDEADRELQPLLGFGNPVLTAVERMPYPQVNTLLDDGFPRGALNYWKSSFLDGLSAEAIDTLAKRFPASPSPMTGMVMEHFHGAATRVPVSETPVPHREPGYNLLIASVWMDPETTDANVVWTRETYAALEPYLARRRWLNYLGNDESPDAVASAYGPNSARLAEIKRRYDPDNVFHANQNIKPAAA